MEGQIKYRKNKLYRVVQSDTLYNRSDLWMIIFSREGEKYSEFQEIRKLIIEKPLKDGINELRKDSPLKAVENILGELCLEKIKETN